MAVFMMLSTVRVPVSVIIPCYCCADTIERAVQSVCSQSEIPEEIILVEDASPDSGETFRVLSDLSAKYAGFIKIQVLVLKKNVGAGEARNCGWAVATQPYIAFLDADDAWLPSKIEVQYGVMRENPNCFLSAHKHKIYETSMASNSPVIDLGKVPVSQVSQLRALFSNPFATRTVMIKNSVGISFAKDKRYAEDYLLWVEILSSGLTCLFIDSVLAVSYKTAYGCSGLASNLLAMQLGELDCFSQLYRKKMIGPSLLFFAIIFSVLKFFRRCAIVFYLRVKFKAAAGFK